MNEPINPRLRDALGGAADRGTPKGADAVVRVARSESAHAALVEPTPLAATRPSRRSLFVTLASAAAVIAVFVGVVAVTGRITPTTVDADSPEKLLSFLQESTNNALAEDTFRVRWEVSTRNGDDRLGAGSCGAALYNPGVVNLVADPGNRVVQVIDPASGAVREIFTPDATYFSQSILPVDVTIGVPWVRADPRSNVTQELAFALRSAGFTSADDLDPRTLIELVQRSAASATELETEEIDGRSTRHLRVVTDPQRFNEVEIEQRRRRQGAPTGTVVPDVPGTQPPAIVPDDRQRMVFETWIDTEGKLRRLSFTIETQAPDPGGATTPAIYSSVGRIDFTEYGAPMPTAVPTIDQTTPAGDLPATILTASPSLATCLIPVPTDAPADVQADMRALQQCETDVRRRSLEGRTVKEMAGPATSFSEPPQNCTGPALTAWCQTQAPTGGPGDVERLRSLVWCRNGNSFGGVATPIDPSMIPPAIVLDEAKKYIGRVLPADPSSELTPEQLQEAKSVLVGMSEEMARTVVESAKWTVRVVQRDGVSEGHEEDLRYNRLNVHVQGGVVSDVDKNY